MIVVLHMVGEPQRVEGTGDLVEVRNHVRDQAGPDIQTNRNRHLVLRAATLAGRSDSSRVVRAGAVWSKIGLAGADLPLGPGRAHTMSSWPTATPTPAPGGPTAFRDRPA